MSDPPSACVPPPDLADPSPSGVPPDAVFSPPRSIECPSAPRNTRVSALLEVVLCSGFPLQLALSYLMALAGYSPLQGGQLSFTYVSTLLMIDAVVMMALIFWLLYLHDERPRDVFLGSRPVTREALLGLPLIVVVFSLVLVLLTVIQRVAPWLHNVPRNPLEDLISSGGQAAMFTVVATIGGGLREEIQRAFILHRFEQHLGGAWLGLVLFSVVFGAGHGLQGWDAALTTGLLGMFWGVVYLSRRSIVACVVSHSGFNTVEIVRFLVATR